ncbi:hypothetical protein M413DRAFT_29391 [Hebeloma cylindrosporum]|uniref:Uncharacterized protein n=1 Tax=Hebeloma cylindrosporum TaxID=76867 RepID=A0A0C3BRB9_HEBCY|nr:hypothetical protein M413DRAFT_29391 [Hebeloma cylindrosporum h7]
MTGKVDSRKFDIGGETPINEIPPEVLAQIFEAGMVWKQHGFTPENSFFPSREIYGYPPMVYLQVCRYWREVALSTSSLWASCSSAQFSHKIALVPVMKSWLARSSPTAPLNLQLRFQPNFPPLYANSIFRLLAIEVKRWRSMSIELDLSLAQEFAVLLEERTQDLSQLEELEIHLLPKDLPATISQRILAQIPLLKSLRHFTWVSNGRESRDHVFRQLRALAVLDDITIFTPSLFDESIAHLSQCVSATKVRIYDDTCHYYPLQTKPIFPMTLLPRLTFLTLHRFWDAMDMLDYFALPSLEYLKIVTKDDNGTGEGHNLSILRNFLERSKCPLRSLAVEANISDSILTDYLLFPSIRSIPEVQITDDCNNFEQRLLKILETYPNAETAFPPIIQCWIPKTILSLPSIGWSNLSNNEKLIFSWMAGKMDDTAKAIPEFYNNCICRACYDRQRS